MADTRFVLNANVPPALVDQVAPRPDRYVGYFENMFGEVMIFVRESKSPTAMLYHSDMDWEPVVVEGGYAPDIVLNESEMMWLRACWLGTGDKLKMPPALEALVSEYTKSRRSV
jgi:hypothetical protein